MPLSLLPVLSSRKIPSSLQAETISGSCPPPTPLSLTPLPWGLGKGGAHRLFCEAVSEFSVELWKCTLWSSLGQVTELLPRVARIWGPNVTEPEVVAVLLELSLLEKEEKADKEWSDLRWGHRSCEIQGRDWGL